MSVDAYIKGFQQLQRQWADAVPDCFDGDAKNRLLDLAFQAYTYARLHGAAFAEAAEVGESMIKAAKNFE